MSTTITKKVNKKKSSKLPHKEAQMMHSFMAHEREVLTLAYNTFNSTFARL